MRHGNRTKKFGRKRTVRIALMRSLARSLLLHGKIETTEARAKALRPFAERLIARAQNDSLAARRLAARRLGSPAAARILFTAVGGKYATRHGGYTRVVKTGFRRSDGARTAHLELV